MTILSSIFEDLTVRDLPLREQLLQEAKTLPKLVLSQRQLCDLELIMNGGFSPLKGFMAEHDYRSCCKSMRLEDGTLWPIPITLDISEKEVKRLGIQMGVAKIVLVQDEHPERPLSIMKITDLFTYDKEEESQLVYNTMDQAHPAVSYLMQEANDWLIGGPVQSIDLPLYKDFPSMRKTPSELRSFFETHRWDQIVAFQTRNPMHRAHQELTLRAAASIGAKLLIHPVVGMTKPGDIHYTVRVEAYKAIMTRYPKNSALLSLLPLAMRMGGPREVLLHAIIRRNYGCTHLIVGRDHAGPGSDSKGNLFYGPYESQENALKYAEEIGIKIVPFQMVSYCPDTDKYIPKNELPPGKETLNISGTQLRQALQKGEPIPEWFSYPEVVQILRKAYP